MANKDILSIDVSSTSSDSDYVYVNQGSSFVRVKKDKFAEGIVEKAHTLDTDDSELNITAGSEWGDGAWLALRGVGRDEKPGSFEIFAFSEDGESWISLYGNGDGTLTWNGKSIATEDDIDEKYTKPETGIPASDLEDGIIPSDSHINSLIDAKLGVIENGSY